MAVAIFILVSKVKSESDEPGPEEEQLATSPGADVSPEQQNLDEFLQHDRIAVSYTHLTLPTIYSV